MTIRKQPTLPMPRNGVIDKATEAFSVEIPSIPPNTTEHFSLSSRSPVNQKACEYLKTAIRSEQRRKLDTWRAQASRQNRKFNARQLITIQAKMDSLFKPGYLTSHDGRQRIAFITNAEESTLKTFNSWLNARSPDQDRRLFMQTQCVMPVLAAEYTDGTPKYFFYGSGMMAWPLPLRRSPAATSTFEADLTPPQRYFCVSRQPVAMLGGSF